MLDGLFNRDILFNDIGMRRRKVSEPRKLFEGFVISVARDEPTRRLCQEWSAEEEETSRLREIF